MNITVDRRQLHDALGHVANLYKGGGVRPHSPVCLRADGDHLVIEGCALNGTMTIQMPAQVGVPGEVFASCSELRALIRSMVAYAFVTVEEVHVGIRVHEGATDALLTAVDGDGMLPVLRLAEPEGVMRVAAATLQGALARLTPVTCNDESRAELNSILVTRTTGGDGARFVACDSSALVYADAACALEAWPGCLIPQWAAHACASLLKDRRIDSNVTLSVWEDGTMVETYSHRFTWRAPERRPVDYPPYERVIPSVRRGTVTVATAALRGAATRCARFSDATHSETRLRIEGDLLVLDTRRVGGAGAAIETLREDVPATCDGTWETTHVNATLLVRLLEASACAEVSIAWTGDLNVLLWDTSDGLALLMPIRPEW